MNNPYGIDLSNLPRFLEHLATKQLEAAEFASRLLDEGGAVVEFWGPESMDVWDLRIQRGEWVTVFRIERGYAEWARVGKASATRIALDDLRPFGLAILAWARSNQKSFHLDDADDLLHDLMTYGTETLDWLNAGNGAVFDRVATAWISYRRSLWDGREAAARQAMSREALADIEAAVHA